MNHPEDLSLLMQGHGIRPTAGRILVLRTLLQEGRPLSMTEIETLLESVDKSTVSRALAVFRERRLLHSIEDGSGQVRYEVCRCPEDKEEDDDLHVHFHCERCGRTFCFEDVPIPAVAYPSGFSVRNVNYMAHGLCPDCAGRNALPR